MQNIRLASTGQKPTRQYTYAARNCEHCGKQYLPCGKRQRSCSKPCARELKRVCDNARNQARKSKYSRERWLLEQYSMSLSDYDALLRIQKGVCAICKRPERRFDKRINRVQNLSVDHCHKTGAIRGLLCGSCNRAIGLLEDDGDRLDNAIDYLNRNHHDQQKKNAAD